MERDDELREELKRIAPDFPEKHAVPPSDGYFQAFPDRILARWKEEAPVVRKISPWRNIAGIAALIAGLLIGGFWLMSQENQQQPDEITSLEAYQYIHEHIDEFEGMIETEKLTEEAHQFDVPQEEIEEFLMEELNDADVEELF